MNRFCIAAVAAFSTLGASANAALLTFNGLVSGEYGTATVTRGSGSQNVYGGTMSGSLSGYPGTFDMYCVDLDHFVSNGETYSVAVMNPTGNYLLAAKAYSKFHGGVDTADEGLGLQLAIWDFVYDGGDGLGAGNLTVSNVSAGALAFAGTVLGYDYSNVTTNAFFLMSNGADIRQSMIGEPVPEPATLAALGVGLAALARRRRKV